MLLVRTTLKLSPIHGIGLFADQFIEKGAAVWRYLDEFDLRFPPSVLGRLSPPVREQFLSYSYLLEESGLYELCSDDARYLQPRRFPKHRERATFEW